MEREVREAFRKRPGEVEDAEGFLGLEVLSDADDPAIFYLVTRWESREHFEAWHGSDAHKQSHRAIPSGLRLDPKHTRITVMERFHPDPPGEMEPLWLHRALPAAAELGAATTDIHVFLLDRGGSIRQLNAAAAGWLGRSVEELRGRPFRDLLVEHDKERLEEVVRSPCGTSRLLVLGLVDRSQSPYEAELLVRVDPGDVVIIGSPVAREMRELQGRLLAVNNELATVARESERRRRELERTRRALQSSLDELNGAYWHLKKIQEVLPICMSCGKVKSGDRGWQDVVDFLRENSRFLSHGYCPGCAEKVMAELDRSGFLG